MPIRFIYEHSALRALCSYARQMQFHASMIALVGLLLIE